jgi:hypothetical protein
MKLHRISKAVAIHGQDLDRAFDSLETDMIATLHVSDASGGGATISARLR